MQVVFVGRIGQVGIVQYSAGFNGSIGCRRAGLGYRGAGSGVCRAALFSGRLIGRLLAAGSVWVRAELM